MARKKRKADQADEQLAGANDSEVKLDEQASENEPREQTVEEQVDSEQAVDEQAKVVAGLQDEISDLKDKQLRMQAEFENFKRRTKTEKARLYDQSVADVIGAWLPVLDNLQRAQDSIAELICEEKEAMLAGLDLVRKQANEVLDRFGVQEIPALGESFDPELHAAVLHIEDEAYGSGEIVEVFQAGYKRGDQVLRHSVVKVAN